MTYRSDETWTALQRVARWGRLRTLAIVIVSCAGGLATAWFAVRTP